LVQITRTTVVAAAELSPALIARWAAIVEGDAGFASPFFHPSFTSAVARVRRGVSVAVFFQDGEALAFLPFQFRSPAHWLVGAAERVGGHFSDFFGLVAVPGVVLSPRQILNGTGLSVFDFSHLDAGQFTRGLAGERPEAGLRADLNGDWADYWAARKRDEKAFVADTDRQERRIAEALGPLRFTFSSGSSTELQALITAKRAQYQRTGADDALAPRWTRALLETMLHSSSEGCTAVLSTLHAGDTWIASHIGLKSDRVFHYWFPVYNPDVSRFGPGRLLLKMLIQGASASGCRTVDFGAGDHPSKRKFATLEYAVTRGLWYTPGPRAFCFRAAQSIAWRLKREAAPAA